MKHEPWHIELHSIIDEFALKHNLTTNHLLAYHSIVLWGTMALQNRSDKFAKDTLKRMFEHLKNKKKQFQMEKKVKDE